MHDLKREFDTHGYVLLPGFFDPGETAKLLEEITAAQSRMRSTLDRPGLTFRSYLCHSSPYLHSVVAGRKVVEMMTQIIGPDLWVRRDAAVVKGPGGEEFSWHQDNGYSQLLDPYAQLWIALTPMSDANGALRLVPGSHKQGLLPHWMNGSHFVWKGAPKGEKLIAMEPGDALVFSSYLLHQSGPNRTHVDRVAYLVEFMSCRHFDPYTKPPFFVVSANGVSAPRFVRSYEGSVSPVNRLKYIVPRMRRRFQILTGQLKRFLEASRGS